MFGASYLFVNSSLGNMRHRQYPKRHSGDYSSCETRVVIIQRIAGAWWDVTIGIWRDGLDACWESERDGVGGDRDVSICHSCNGDVFSCYKLDRGSC